MYITPRNKDYSPSIYKLMNSTSLLLAHFPLSTILSVPIIFQQNRLFCISFKCLFPLPDPEPSLFLLTQQHCPLFPLSSVFLSIFHYKNTVTAGAKGVVRSVTDTALPFSSAPCGVHTEIETEGRKETEGGEGFSMCAVQRL